MPRYLITPSLHSSFAYFMSSEAGEKKELIDVLNKVPFEKSESMLKGIKFEDDILALTQAGIPITEPTDPYDLCVYQAAKIVDGGLWQEKAYGEEKICGIDFLLYGKSDVMKRDWIYDFKFTGSYEVGKYYDSVQHVIYMKYSGIHKFAYLPCDGKNLWREDYFYDDAMDKLMMGSLSKMVSMIFDDPELKEAYVNNWGSKEDRKVAA